MGWSYIINRPDKEFLKNKYAQTANPLRGRLGVHKGMEWNGMEWDGHKGMERNVFK